MNVTYIGFGGTMDVPCYKDEKGNLYFDVNDGKNGLNLYSEHTLLPMAKYVASLISK